MAMRKLHSWEPEDYLSLALQCIECKEIELWTGHIQDHEEAVYDFTEGGWGLSFGTYAHPPYAYCPNCKNKIGL